MFEEILNLVTKQKCRHPNVTTNHEISYCPDCGELIKINWYLIRCKRCNKKRMGVIKGGKIYPITKFCSNCGDSNYFIEKIKSINYFDISYAIVSKDIEEITQNHPDMQIWIDKEHKQEEKEIKLLPNLGNRNDDKSL